MTLCEAIVQYAAQKIREQVERRSHSDPDFKVEVVNIRTLRRDTRDLLQDLRDAAEGIEIVHAGDMQKAAAQKKRERKQNRLKSKIKRMERLIISEGLENLGEIERSRAVRLLDQERINALEYQRETGMYTSHQQLTLFGAAEDV